MNILILGGTQDAITAARLLHERGHRVTSALAGATENPVRPAGKFITGGFGGPDGLTAYLETNDIDCLVDATHPFAAKMSASAVISAEKAKVPLLRLTRPPFKEPEGADWWRVDSKKEAAERLPSGAKAFLTIGRRGLQPFLDRTDVRFLLRSIDRPQIELPANFTAIQDRPPFSRAQETALMRKKGITHLITKDSGGEQTSAKLEAAFMLRVQVIIISRPPLPPAREVQSPDQLVQAINQLPEPERRSFFLPWLRRIWAKFRS